MNAVAEVRLTFLPGKTPTYDFQLRDTNMYISTFGTKIWRGTHAKQDTTQSWPRVARALLKSKHTSQRYLIRPAVLRGSAYAVNAVKYEHGVRLDRAQFEKKTKKNMPWLLTQPKGVLLKKQLTLAIDPTKGASTKRSRLNASVLRLSRCQLRLMPCHECRPFCDLQLAANAFRNL